MATFDVNTDQSIKLTSKLERLNRSAFPSAVRNTLNTAAFEMKKEIPKTASKKFITRQKGFFKRMSLVDKAKGFDLRKMKSTVGIDGKDRALADNLESQEFGGRVKGNKLVPHDDARVSKSKLKRVSSRNYLNKVKIHDASKAFKSHRGTRSSKFTSAVMSTIKRGKKDMLMRSKNKGIVYRISSVKRNKSGVKFKLKKIYVFRKKKISKVRSNNYMMDSAILTTKKIPKFYKNNAEFQFKKALK